LLLPYRIGRRNGQAVTIRKELFYRKYYSIAFAILPSIAGGLALELPVLPKTLNKRLIIISPQPHPPEEALMLCIDMGSAMDEMRRRLGLEN